MGLRVTGLTADGVETPLGIEEAPSLSWRLESDRRGARQTAYRILVATVPELLAEGTADAWDSGRVEASSSLGIRYGGSPLTSRTRLWWTVQVWDGDGETAVAELSWWETGLTRPDDWGASWLVAEDASATADRVFPLEWIWGADVEETAPRRFRYRFGSPSPVTDGLLLIGAGGRRLTAWIDGRRVSGTESSDNALGLIPAEEIPLAGLGAGEHVVAVEVHPPHNIVDTGRMAAFVRLVTAEGARRLAGADGWRTAPAVQDAGEGWTEASFDDAAWDAATAARAPSWSSVEGIRPPEQSVLLRTDFATASPISRARLYVAAWGAYEARINGERVADDVLSSECTYYRKRVLYRVHDVTSLVATGDNVLALTVADGWFASTLVGHGRYAWGPAPRRVIAQLELTHADGSTSTVRTGPGWRIAPGPVLRAEIYDGEVYDARLEQPGWDTPGFDDADWPTAVVAETPDAVLAAQVGRPIRRTQTMPARTVAEPVPGEYVVDFGQNFAGWCRLRTRGAAGTTIRLRFGEILTPDGRLDQSNLRGAKQRDVYVLRGDPDGEVVEPRFTYHGFRYVEVTGSPARIRSEDIDGIVVGSDLPTTGELAVGQPLVDRIWRNVVWTQRSNLIGIATDCPQRDERLGWLGDAGMFWDSATFGMDLLAFTRRILQNAVDSQGDNGAYPNAAPLPLPETGDAMAAPGWSDAVVILAWRTWERYRDRAALERHWDSLVRYLESIERGNPDLVWRNGRDAINDWLAPDDIRMFDEVTPADLYATAYWAHSADLLGRIAAVLARVDDEARFRGLFDRIRSAFQREFIRDDGTIGSGSQTSYLLALAFDLVPEAVRAAARGRLAAEVRARGGALGTGIVGTQFLLDALADAGETELAIDLLLRREYPSWGYMIDQGATTMWEGWDAKVWSGGDGGRAKMPNSFNQYTLGSLVGFLYRRLAGIAPAAPGFERIEVRPILDPRIPVAGADYDSIVGRISTRIRQGPGGSLELDVVVPANATARVHVPAAPGAQVREGGLEVEAHPDVSVVGRFEREAVLDIGSGSYRFTASAPDPAG